MTKIADDSARKELLISAYRKIEELRARLAERERRETEPVAVIGMGCRFPGGSTDPEAYWQTLSSGIDGITEVPRDRWNVDEFYDPDPEKADKMYVRRGGFIEKMREFDPLFFRLSPQEATSMEPQQRLLLEVSWEALENAGQAPDRLSGSRTGVFVGMGSGDFASLAMLSKNDFISSSHAATGNTPSVAAGRLSYFYDLRGPCMVTDAACASALTAIHLAVQSLRRGESKMALAGSVNLIVSPITFIAICRARMLSPEGQCKTFDAAANGYVRSEGCGVLVLKLLSRAQADGDRILAVIRGSACNQDGRTNGITAPNGNAQREVIHAALADAGVSPAEIDFVETHGTGTSLGDPIELQALGEVFAPGRPAGRNLILGAVKSNIGHLETAAGMASIAKAILVLQKGQIPPNLHFYNPNPLIPWDSLPFAVPTKLMPWPETGRRLAGVSAFGFSGTNAHLVLEQAPASLPAAPGPDRPCHLLTLSAQAPAALTELAARYVAYLEQHPDAPLADLCHTANTGRAQLPYRIAVSAATIAELKARLEAFAARPGSGDSVCSGRAPVQPPQLGMLILEEPFSGLHRELYRQSPVFKAAFDACDSAALELFGVSLAASLGTEPMALQPPGDAVLPFALCHAMAAQWREWGIEPAAVSGSGIGACAAAVFAGAISLAGGLRLAVDPRAGEGGAIEWSTPRITLLSSLTGQPLTCDSLKQPAEWVHAAGDSAEHAVILEAFVREGTHTVLAAGAPGDSTLSCIAAPGSEWAGLLHAMGALFVAGVAVDWQKIESPWNRKRIALPTYPFQRHECWMKTTPAVATRSSQRKDAHPWLGRRIHSPQFRDEIVYEAEFSLDRFPMVKDHTFFKTPVVPAAAMLEMAMAAGRLAFDGAMAGVDDLAIEQPLSLIGSETKLVQTVLTPSGADAWSFNIVSADIDDDAPAWKRHCSGRLVKVEAAASGSEAGVLDRLRARYEQSVDPEWFYEKAAGGGLEYGPSFRLIRTIHSGDDGSLTQVQLPPDAARPPSICGIDPGLLDAALQSIGILAAPDTASVYMLVAIGSCRLTVSAPSEIWCHTHLRDSGEAIPEILSADIRFYSGSGERLGEALGIRLKRTSRTEIARAMTGRQLASWLFEPTWEPLPALVQAAENAGRWLIVSDGHPGAATLAIELRRRHGSAVAAGPGSAEDYDALFQSALASPEPLRGVVYFASPSRRDSRNVPLMASSATGHLLHLTQALARNLPGDLGALAVVTEGFHTPEIGLAPSLAGSAPWGLGRTIAAELPGLHCKLIDLDHSLPAEAAAVLLADELCSGADENQVALGDGKRLALRLAQARPSILTDRHSGLADLRGAYLITGGLGGLGLLVARSLASRGASHLVLVGRKAPKPEAQAATREIEALGARITVAQADVGDRGQLGQLLAEHFSPAEPLRGIVHAAGVLEDGVLLSQDWARFERVLRPKIDGAWNLHELTLGMPLDFFVLFSSSAGLLGSAGQSNYAAGNVFLDTLALARQAAGLPALSIDWGAWGEVGMAAALDERHAKGWSAAGVKVIEPAQGVAVLEALMANPQIAQVAVLPVEKSAWQPAAGRAIPPFFRNLAKAAGLETAPVTASNISGAAERLRQAPEGEKLAILIELIGEIVLDTFEVDHSHSIPPDQNLTMLGMDSLLAIQLSNRLKTAFGASVPSTLTFQYPTIEDIAGYLLETLPAIGSAPGPDANGTAIEPLDPGDPLDPEKARTLLANLDQISDEEVEALLGAIETQPGSHDH